MISVGVHIYMFMDPKTFLVIDSHFQTFVRTSCRIYRLTLPCAPETLSSSSN